jgi:hypothetical protein
VGIGDLPRHARALQTLWSCIGVNQNAFDGHDLNLRSLLALLTTNMRELFLI